MAVDDQPENPDPFIVQVLIFRPLCLIVLLANFIIITRYIFFFQLCYAKRKSIFTAQAHEKGITNLREFNIDTTAISVGIETGLVCIALSSGRYVFLDTNAQKKSMKELFTFDSKEVSPKIVNAGKEEFLVLGPGGLGVFTTSMGTSEKPPIIWQQSVHSVVIDGINVVAMANDVIFVNRWV